MNAEERYALWLEKSRESEDLHQELLSIREDPAEIEDRFYQDLTFGTAGLRGKLGAGTNRMNFRTVGRATQGIADYIRSCGKEYMDRGVVIAHDCRHFSKEFSRLAAEILACAGIRVYTFPDMRPTPELSYAVRQLHAASGINITASHNPKECNGYKAYWEDGAQVSSAVAEGMLKKIEQVDYFSGIQRMDFDKAVREGRITILAEQMDRSYLDMVESLAIHEGDELDLSLPLVYTPLNGAGSIPVQTVLRERGFTNIHVVPQQKDPDPDFTTVGYPNPEDHRAFRLSEELGRETGAEILIATDPDSDRLAVELREEDGSYSPLNGNQAGVLLIHYILEGRKEKGTLPAKGAMVKSIVTGRMGTAICAEYGIPMFETLTGFKNICGKIPWLEQHGYTYLFGYEESIGYAASEQVRDKDGVSASMLMAEAAAYYRRKGRSVLQVMEELYKKYGYYAEDQVSIVLEGEAGAGRIARMMERVRENPPVSVGGRPVERIVDYRNGYEDVPASNVLRFELGEGNWLAMRPSGTEPKIKFYFYARGSSKEEAERILERVRKDLLDIVNAVK